MNRIATCLLTCALAALATRAAAGPLATAPNAYVDEFSNVWHGSTPFQGYYDPGPNTQPSGLTGYVDWAVFAPDVLPAGFVGDPVPPYVPTAGEFLYTYQLTITGEAPLSSFTVSLENDLFEDNIGQFTATGVIGDPSIFFFLLPGDSANWSFGGVGGSENPVLTTMGLAFSSPHGPMMSTGMTIDDGTYGPVAFVPAPVPKVPEPGAMTLAMCGLCSAGLAWANRLRQRHRFQRHHGVTGS